MARKRIRDAAPGAVETLIRLTEYADTDSVKRLAASDLLDRAGLKTPDKLQLEGKIETTSPLIELQVRLAAIAKRSSGGSALDQPGGESATP